MHMSFHSPDLARYIKQAPAIPADKDRSEVRVYATLLTGAAFWSLVSTAFYIWSVADTPLHKVTSLTGHTGLCVGVFVVLALMLLPHLVSLLALPQYLGYQLPRKMVAGAMVGAGFFWGYLATLAHPLDLGLLPLTYWLSCAGYMLVGGAFGYSLNAQQAIEQLADENASETR